MGNAFWPCLKAAAPAIELIFWGGATERITLSRRANPLLAGEIMFRFPDQVVVCHADSFFIGRPMPALSVGNQLLPGHTYFILPVDRLPDLHDPLTAASLTSLSASRNTPRVAGGGRSPFEYVRGADGRAAIKVHPEFVTKLISVCDAEESCALCSTPELKKHYQQLVGSKDRRPWSPKLESIEEKEKEKRWLLHSTSKLLTSPANTTTKMTFRSASSAAHIIGAPLIVALTARPIKCAANNIIFLSTTACNNNTLLKILLTAHIVRR